MFARLNYRYTIMRDLMVVYVFLMLVLMSCAAWVHADDSEAVQTESPYFDHQHGSFIFKKVGHKLIEVTWESCFVIPSQTIPPKILSTVSGWMVKAAFKSALMILDRKLQEKRQAKRLAK